MQLVLKELPGHDHPKEQLLQWFRQGRLPHALLFSGPEGNGKLATALAFTRLLMCQEPREEKPCDTCKSCIQNASLVHPDVHFTFPFFGSKNTCNDFLPEFRKTILANPWCSLNDWIETIVGEENKQLNINVLECQRIAENVHLTAFESGWKVLLIWLPEYLGNDGNRILKILEEPPPKTLFLLISERPEGVLHTVQSRCQMVPFGHYQLNECQEVLEEMFDISRQTAKELSIMTEGNIAAALNLQREEGVTLSSDFLAWMRVCYAGGRQIQGIGEWSDQMSERPREVQKLMIHQGIALIRQILRVRILGISQVVLQDNMKDPVMRLSQLLHEDSVQELTRILSEILTGIERNGNMKIIFFSTSLKIHEVMMASRNQLASAN